MIFLILLINFFSFDLAESAPLDFHLSAKRCLPSKSSCSIYPCLSQKLQCSEDNYLLSIGKPICERFLDPEREGFSPKAQRALHKIRHCLQQKVAKVESCNEIEGTFQSVHLECYSNVEYCELSWADKMEVFFTLSDFLLSQRFFNWESVETAQRIDSFCGSLE